MVVKVYISRTSADKEVKYRQQAVLQILDLKKIPYNVIDISDTDNTDQKEFMQQNSTFLGKTALENEPSHPLPPQIFNDDDYCGDFMRFEMANENRELDLFLKLVPTNNNLYNSEASIEISQTADI